MTGPTVPVSGPEDGARDLMADLRASLDAAREVPVVADTTAGEAESLVGVLVRAGVWPLAVAERAAAALAARSGGAQDDGLRDALRIHHPIMRSETGPFSGCRCGGVGLGQDVIAHVAAELRRALAGPDDARQDGAG